MLHFGRIDISRLESFDAAKPYIFPAFVCVGMDTTNMVTGSILDLKIRYMVNASETENVVVSKDLIERWGVTEEAIYRAALENQNDKMMFGSLVDYVDVLTRGESTEIFEGIPTKITEPLNFLTTKSMHYGATAILTKWALGAIYEANGHQEYYIIPSSVHEVLICTYDGITKDELKELIKNVNSEEVREEDRLSYNLYKYNGREIVIV